MPRALLILIAAAVVTSGCVTVNTPISGLLYNNSKGPTTVGTGDAGTKTGTACSTGTLGFVMGDASLEAAKAQGGITKVAYVDHTAFSVLGIYAKYCAVVHGE